jgi:hypothetical protein
MAIGCRSFRDKISAALFSACIKYAQAVPIRYLDRFGENADEIGLRDADGCTVSLATTMLDPSRNVESDSRRWNATEPATENFLMMLNLISYPCWLREIV